MFRLDYTVYEDGNNFMPAETFTLPEVLAKIAELLTDTGNVRSVQIERDGHGPDDAPAELTALSRIIDKRHEQLIAGYTPDRDDARTGEQLALAAATYALPEKLRPKHTLHDKPAGWFWPWAREKFNSDADRLDQLAEAGALILAEMERITRRQRRQVAEATAAFAELRTREAALEVVRSLKKED